MGLEADDEVIGISEVEGACLLWWAWQTLNKTRRNQHEK
jgi:hypothetical protein